MWNSANDTPIVTGLSEGVLEIRFNRPEVRNAMSRQMVLDMGVLLAKAQADPKVRCILFTGAGRHFSAGGDVDGFRASLELSAEERRSVYRERLTQAEPTIKALAAFDRPVVTRLRGSVAGAGLVYALAADVVLSDDSTKLVFAHQALGLIPDGGTSYFLPRVVGPRAARRLILMSEPIDAAEAHRLTIIDRIMPAQSLDEAAWSTAQKLARSPQMAVVGAKALLQRSIDNDIDTHMAEETAKVADCVAQQDFVEGVSAFLEKRGAAFPSAR